jgi:hypothetical protein
LAERQGRLINIYNRQACCGELVMCLTTRARSSVLLCRPTLQRSSVTHCVMLPKKSSIYGHEKQECPAILITTTGRLLSTSGKNFILISTQVPSINHVDLARHAQELLLAPRTHDVPHTHASRLIRYLQSSQSRYVQWARNKLLGGLIRMIISVKQNISDYKKNNNHCIKLII